MLEVAYIQRTWHVCFFQPILISKQLQQTLLPFPVELAVVFCYSFNAAAVCTCLLICLVKLLRGIKMQTEIDTFPFFREERLHQYLCLHKESKQEDIFHVFWGGEVEKK